MYQHKHKHKHIPKKEILGQPFEKLVDLGDNYPVKLRYKIKRVLFYIQDV